MSAMRDDKPRPPLSLHKPAEAQGWPWFRTIEVTLVSYVAPPSPALAALTPLQREILAACSSGPLTTKQIAHVVRKPPGSSYLRTMLRRLTDAGFLTKRTKGYVRT